MVPLIVLDDINAIFDDPRLNEKYSKLIRSLLFRMDGKSCNSIFLSSDSSSYTELISIQGMSKRIRLFYFGELEEASFIEGIHQEETYRFYEEEKLFFERFIVLPVSNFK